METLKTKKIISVQAPCFIAYRDPLAGYFWLRPYVDLGLRNKIWGIAINGQVFKLVHEEDGSWYQAKKLGDTLSRAKMPSTTVIDIASYYRREFNATIEQLQQLGIKAEPWRRGWYWTTEDDGEKATVMDMANGQIDFVEKKMRNGYVRLVSNYITQKPDCVGYTLAYLINGHLELSSDFRANLKDKLWGLHIAKSYLCMKLTYEPQKMTVNEGLELGKTLSTDALCVDLPSRNNVDDIGKEKDTINDTLVKLSAYGVKVDLLQSKEMNWLTNTLWNKKGFITYGNRFISIEEACTCRLFAKNKGKTVII